MDVRNLPPIVVFLIQLRLLSLLRISLVQLESLQLCTKGF